MVLRSISETAVEQVLAKPETTAPTEKPDTTKFIRVLNGREIQVIARRLPTENKTLVISVWVRGEDDPADIVWSILSFPFVAIWRVCSFLLKRIF